MAHTNHRRKDQPRKDSLRYKASPRGSDGRISLYADKLIGASWGGDNSNGHRGYAKAKRGAKKFVRSRVRFAENQKLNEELRKR